MMAILGIDIGGSGIKGAPVDTERGLLLTERLRFDTPQPSTPDAVVEVVCALVEHFDWRGPVGCAFPAIVKQAKRSAPPTSTTAGSATLQRNICVGKPAVPCCSATMQMPLA